jgi:hypothetical protein
MLDNFYSCVITPLFFVECLADLAKERRNSTPEQHVRSLADRTPEDGTLTIHHLDVLRFELDGQFSMVRLKGGPFPAGAKAVQLGDSKGMIFLPTKEHEAMQRWQAKESRRIFQNPSGAIMSDAHRHNPDLIGPFVILPGLAGGIDCNHDGRSVPAMPSNCASVVQRPGYAILQDNAPLGRTVNH